MPDRDDHPRAAGATEARLAELLERYGGLLRRTLIHFCPRDLGLDFDDLEQEARLRLWRSLQRATEIAHPASYLYRLAASVTIDAIRRATARREEALEEVERALASGDSTAASGLAAAVTAADPASLVERRLELARASAALATLPPPRRRAVGLHLQGFSPAEIGELLGWSEAKARSLVYRGLEELRRLLAAGGKEG